MIKVILYNRKDCHLCDIARDELLSLQNQYPHELIEVDIDSSDELQTAYGLEIPVLEIGPYTLKAPIDQQDIQITLAAAYDRERHIDEIKQAKRRNERWTNADRFTYWFSRHYLALFNLFVIVYLGLPILAPVLMKAGIETPARPIYRVYGMVCHQLSFRSIFLFGEQPFYPRESAGVANLLTFEQATGLSEAPEADALYGARSFVGNDRIGYKIALCQRDVAIYAGILLFGLLFGVTGRRIPSLPWYLWILLGIVPIGLDGLTQVISQPPLNFIPFRESTPFFRVLSGFLFGFTTAWFGYPLVEETMGETRQIMAAKRLRLQKAGKLGEENHRQPSD